jgi:hypothetical protein
MDYKLSKEIKILRKPKTSGNVGNEKLKSNKNSREHN